MFRLTPWNCPPRRPDPIAFWFAALPAKHHVASPVLDVLQSQSYYWVRLPEKSKMPRKKITDIEITEDELGKKAVVRTWTVQRNGYRLFHRAANRSGTSLVFAEYPSIRRVKKRFSFELCIALAISPALSSLRRNRRRGGDLDVCSFDTIMSIISSGDIHARTVLAREGRCSR